MRNEECGIWNEYTRRNPKQRLGEAEEWNKSEEKGTETTQVEQQGPSKGGTTCQQKNSLTFEYLVNADQGYALIFHLWKSHF